MLEQAQLVISSDIGLPKRELFRYKNTSSYNVETGDIVFQLQAHSPYPHHRPGDPPPGESISSRFSVVSESFSSRDSKTTESDSKSTPREGGRWWGVDESGEWAAAKIT